MTYFREALSAPALHFKRLRQAEPLLCNGAPIVRRTHTAIETEIVWEGRHYLLYLPFCHESTLHIEQLEKIAEERRRGPLVENIILREEFIMVNSLGQRHALDVILQALPSGAALKEAVNNYRADDLRAAVQSMKSRLDAIGFRHNNLTPSNVIICESGTARPLRYWYAEWEIYSDNDISQLLTFIDSNCNEESNTALSHPLAQDCEAEYVATSSKGGITRLYRGYHYGFIDEDGRQITPFIYTWASDFQEGRAIVAKNGKMGAIDSLGRKVIPVIYNSLEFDIETGFFTATRGSYSYLINYEGEIIRRTKEVEAEKMEQAQS
jgi:hypothetical protein